MMIISNGGITAAGDGRTSWIRNPIDLDRHIQRERVPQAQSVEEPSTPDFHQLGDKLIQLQAGDEEFCAVADKFYAGPGMVSEDVTITAIYRDSHSSTTGLARLRAFEQQIETTGKLRGEENVNLRFGWHGTSKSGVQGIILHGFGQPRRPKNGACYGTGVYLSPHNYSNLSAVYSDVDEKGEQHMVLCQLILGVSELVQIGSEQFHPSSEGFDTGVDDIADPKRYIIWSTHMNSHILSKYVVSFKQSESGNKKVADSKNMHKLDSCCASLRSRAESCLQAPHGDLNMGITCRRKAIHCAKAKLPQLKNMSFPELFTLLQMELPPANLVLLKQKYLCFKAGKLSRTSWARCVRLLVGDNRLVNAIKTLQKQIKDVYGNGPTSKYDWTCTKSNISCIMRRLRCPTGD